MLKEKKRISSRIYPYKIWKGDGKLWSENRSKLWHSISKQDVKKIIWHEKKKSKLEKFKVDDRTQGRNRTKKKKKFINSS